MNYPKGHIYHGKTEEQIMSLKLRLAQGTKKYVQLYNEYQLKYGHGKTFDEVVKERIKKSTPTTADSKRIERGNIFYGY